MPSPGYLKAQVTVVDSIAGKSKTGTLVYEGTIVAVGTSATIVGGAVLKTNKLQLLDQVGIVSVKEATGSIVSGKVIDFGKHLGTLTGTAIGTVVADTNFVIVQLAQPFSGTIPGESQPAAGTSLTGVVIELLEVGA